MLTAPEFTPSRASASENRVPPQKMFMVDGAAGELADVILEMLDDLAAGLGLVVNGGEVDGQGVALDGLSLGSLLLSGSSLSGGDQPRQREPRRSPQQREPR